MLLPTLNEGVLSAVESKESKIPDTESEETIAHCNSSLKSCIYKKKRMISLLTKANVISEISVYY